MINLFYLLEVSMCWLLFYALYQLFFKKETFFELNRFYLIGAVLGGLILPTIEFWPTELVPSGSSITSIYLQEITISLEHTAAQSIFTNWAWKDILFIIYMSGLIFFSLRFLAGCLGIFWLLVHSTREKIEHYYLIKTDKQHAPFSFFGYLFVSKQDIKGKEGISQVYTHEKAHIDGWHSIDVLLLEVLSIVFWFHPMIYLFRKDLRDVHEYLADAEVLKTTSKVFYSHLLLEQSLPGFRLGNNFNHSQLKKRLKMMTKLKSPRQAMSKYLLIVPALICATIFFSCQEKEAQVEPTSSLEKKMQKKSNKANSKLVQNEQSDSTPLTENQKDAKKKWADGLTSKLTEKNQPNVDYFNIVDEMPMFPGCEGISDYKDRKNCAEKKMLEYIYTNIKYPESARTKGKSGMVVISFVVNKTGTLTKFKLERDPGYMMGEESLRVMQSMPLWNPGKQNGEAVNVKFTLPVRFRLADD